MTIVRIQDSMQFEEAYIMPSYGLEIRLYATKKSGMYGYQFAAIAWYKGNGYASSKTSGCGYDKASTAIAQALYYASRGLKFSEEKQKKISHYEGTGQIRECIAEFLGLDYSKWRATNLIHSHG